MVVAFIDFRCFILFHFQKMSCKASCKSIPLEPPPFFNLTQLQPLLLVDDYNDDFLIHKTSKMCYHQMKFKSASTTTTTLSHQQTTYVYLIIILIITIILLIFLIALIVGVYIVKLNRNNNNNNANFYIKTSTMSSLSHDLLSLKPSDLRTTTATTSISSLTTPVGATINKIQQQSTQPHQYDSIRENANEFYYSYDALPTYNIIYNPYLNGHLV
jgi:hypothetical protein